MPRYEYDWEDIPAHSTDYLEAMLKERGDDGWELVAAIILHHAVRHYFKRLAPDGA